MYCTFCGKKLTGTESYCPQCGNKIKSIITTEKQPETLPGEELTPPMSEVKAKKKRKDVLPLTEKKNKLAGAAYSFSALTLELGSVVVIYLAAILFAIFIHDEETFNSAVGYVVFGTQFVLIAYVLIFCKVNHLGPKDVGIRKPQGAMVVVMGVLLGFFGMFSVNIPESIFMEFLVSLGYNTSEGSILGDLPTDGVFFYITFALVAILPAIFEEILFRGIILENTKHLGTWQACVINGLLFSLFHTNPAQTGYTFLMGMIWALVAIRANSIIPTMLVHLVNNGYSVVMLAIGSENVPEWFPLLIVYGSLIVTILGLCYFIGINRNGQTKKSGSSLSFYLAALPGIAINVFIWITAFVGNVAQGAEPLPEAAVKFLSFFL